MDVALAIWMVVGAVFFFRQFWERGSMLILPVLSRLLGRG
jgi:hypothetical protein